MYGIARPRVNIRFLTVGPPKTENTITNVPLADVHIPKMSVIAPAVQQAVQKRRCAQLVILPMEKWPITNIRPSGTRVMLRGIGMNVRTVQHTIPQ